MPPLPIHPHILLHRRNRFQPRSIQTTPWRRHRVHDWFRALSGGTNFGSGRILADCGGGEKGGEGCGACGEGFWCVLYQSWDYCECQAWLIFLKLGFWMVWGFEFRVIQWEESWEHCWKEEACMWTALNACRKDQMIMLDFQNRQIKTTASPSEYETFKVTQNNNLIHWKLFVETI